MMPGYPCAVCRRSGGAVTVQRVTGPMVQYCSEDCARMGMAFPDLKQDEKAAALQGGQEAGDYLDRIGKTDLATLSAAEWGAFCCALFAGACAAMRKAADDEIPF